MTEAAYADAAKGTGKQYAAELGGREAIAFGSGEAQRTLDEAEAILAAWSSEPGGWTDAARTARWHTAGRLDLYSLSSAPRELAAE